MHNSFNLDLSKPNLAEAAHFLKLLDPEATEFTFQTFDDNADRDDKSLVRVLHGSLEQLAARLSRLNAKGAGIFITINETDLKGRKAENIKKVRAVFSDLDGAPLEPVKKAKLKPHIIVESSPERWHPYWRAEGIRLEDFGAIQKAIIERFDADPNIHDLPRVMRLPGFYHRKGDPFLVRIIDSHDGPPYPAINFEKAKVEQHLPDDEQQRETDPGKIKAALTVIPADEYRVWYQTAAVLNFELGEDGFELFDEWSKTSPKYNALKVRRKWADCRKITGYRAATLYYFANQASPGWFETYQEKMLQATYDSIRANNAAPPDPEQLKEEKPYTTQEQPKTQEQPAAEASKQQPKSGIHATPFAWIDPTKVPQRQWLYKPHYIRQFVSSTISTGGIGKSSLLIAEALAMISGKPLLNSTTDELLRVWYWNGEDPFDELQRRFGAAIKHFGLEPDDIGDRLFLDSGRNMPIVLVEEVKHLLVIAAPVVKDIIETLIANEIDVLMIDPFISCHRISENDNAAIDRVAKTWAAIAEVANCSIMLAHHTRKTMGGNNISVDDGRGASALRDAVRSGRSLNNMTEKEAENAQVDLSKRTFYFRSDIGKKNLTPPAESADWFKLVSVDLENNPVMPGMPGDEIGVVTAWEYPTVDITRISVTDIKRAQDEIAVGGGWRKDQRTKERWVGNPIAKALDIDIALEPNRKRVLKYIDTWLASGLLRIEARPDPGVKHHNLVEFIVAGRAPELRDEAGF